MDETVVNIDGQELYAEPYIRALRAENASLMGIIGDVREQNRLLRAKLREYERDDRHIIELREDGFTIQHPLACRPNLFDCQYNLAARDTLDEAPGELGRFYCSTDDYMDLVIEERVPDA